ncbi:SH3 domain-containing protein [Palleronia sp. LCG004]|uniref:SH3 domain-containing protein n=1 Tax=Palleronia sp. LCG004 TaxID=3079304 RepID=UPI00294357A1|nr:SH3 domain-containing protein [Palleronia sp. LCG004]WOI58087.1 SH3 domain-containing protein [Palleronia sp. LCG004]
MTFIANLAAAAILCATTTFALAQDRSVDVRFPPGATGTTLEDRVVGRDTILFNVGAEAGQVMEVALSADNTATYFNVYAPGRGPGDEALAASENTNPINAWRGTLSMSGTYTIAVYLYRNAARRGERADFTLDISVLGKAGGRSEGDAAGGPDFLQAAVGGGNTLNLRARPSESASVVTRLINGQNVRNQGCRMSEGRRWCRVATLADPGYEGWAAGNFLVEGEGIAVSLPEEPPGMSMPDAVEPVAFAPGASGARLKGRLDPGDARSYTLDARDGQFLTVQVLGQGPAISYRILNPDGTVLLDEMMSDRDYRGQLWQTGVHAVQVMNHTANVADYTVVFGIE